MSKNVMTAPSTVTELFETVETAGAKCTRQNRRHNQGEAGRQGDVYITPIAKRPEAWDVLVEEHHQVAVGATTGSRHIATGPVKVFWPKSKAGALAGMPIEDFMDRRKTKLSDEEKQTCIGPVVEATSEWCLEHPEHAHHVFPAGTYLVTYQFDERTRREVAD
jgi:hypothetical protein